jgi:DNA-binding NarL/FixJ family response regulator
MITPLDPIRVVMIDDHAIVRRGLQAVLELEPDIMVAGQASNPTEALAVVADVNPDIVLLDLKLGASKPDEGFKVCREIVASKSTARVIIFTAFLNRQLLLEAIKLGASGYVQKEVDAGDLLKIVRAVHAGEVGFDNQAVSLLVGSVGSGAEDGTASLSERETEIVRLVAQGLTNVEIAKQCFLSESTVKYHLRRINHNLGVTHRAEMVFVVTRLGLISD